MATIFQRIADATVSPSPRSADRRAIGWTLGLLLALSAGLAGRAWVDQADQTGPVADGAQSMLPAQPTDDLGGTPHAGTTPLQQYTAAGHILGFGVLASGSHALQISFVDAQPVAPQSAGAVVAAQSQKAPPLTEVRYPDVWPGVDLSYRAAPGGIAESVWRLAPGADPASIRLRYNRPLTLNADGSLAIRFATGILNESAPVAWQERDGHRQPVAVAFMLKGEDDLGFTLGVHDASLPVWIDPTLTWNTFLGGTDGDHGLAIAVDGSGKVYVSGYSAATWGNPVRAHNGNGDSDAFVAQLDGNGALIWNTFFGGKTYSDHGAAIAVDGSGKVYVSGGSFANWGNPVRAHNGKGDSDAFVAQLDSRSGELIWNTFLGGADWDEAVAIAVDGSGKIYVSGYSTATWGSPMQPYSGNADAFVAQLDSRSGALTWYTFLGGAGLDKAAGIAVDGSGKVYVSGESNATWGNPVRAYSVNVERPTPDAFVAQLDSDSGALIWNTFLGGTSGDFGQAIAVDGSAKVYVSGSSGATWGNPVRALDSYNSEHDAFVAQLDSSGTLIWNTFLGGAVGDFSNAVAVDGSSKVYVSGLSGTYGGYGLGKDDPDVTWGSPMQPYSGGGDAFIAQLDSSTGALIWNTFLGGADRDVGEAIAVDGSGKVYVSGYSPATWGDPVRTFTKWYSMGDAFVAQFSVTPGTTNTLTITKTSGGAVTSSPRGINCGATCRASFSVGSIVTLTPHADTGFTFKGWSGACSGTEPCVVTMDSAKSVSATFNFTSVPTYTLILAKTGNGTITSSPEGIDCGTTCSATFNSGKTVTLKPTAGAGYTFSSWGGACSGAGACTVTMNGDQTVTAQFVTAGDAKYLLKVTKASTGRVTSSPGGIVCGGQERACSGQFATVTLTAVPNSGYAFKNWVGCPGSTGPKCTLTLTQPATVRAIFAKLPKYQLKITKTKNGLITSDPKGLKCGYTTKTCNANFVSGTSVRVTATPKPGAAFTGWSGACSGKAATCTLIMDGKKGVGATFQ